MAEKVTIMKLKVDLECEKCYKKVKKLLSKYPQIRDQTFEEKQNIVTITVVCCSPEKIRDKLCCKGGGSIKSIEIVEPSKETVEPSKAKPPQHEKKKVKFVEPEQKKEDEKPKPKPKSNESEKKQEPAKKKEAEKPKSNESEKKQEPAKKKEAEKPKVDAPKKDVEKPKEKPAEPKPVPGPAPVSKIFDPVPAQSQVPPPMAVPVGMFCVPAYEGRPVGPYVNEYGGPPLCYDGYYGRPIHDSYGSRPIHDSYGGRPYYASHCDQYFNEENAEGCTIM